MTLLGVQRRLVELGRIRLGDKGSKGEPRKLTSFRLTSASRHHLEAAAKVYGGAVRPWTGAPDEGYFELLTTSAQLDILIPPTLSAYSQFYELWDAGGCQRRCDGEVELISGGACVCDPDQRDCKVTTRVSVMLPKVPGLGVWRLETHGWNAAASLPSTLDLLGTGGRGSFIPAVLRLEQRSSKRKENGRTLTRRFVVPVIDLVGITITDLLTAAETDTALVTANGNGHTSPALPAPTGPSRPRERVARPELPAPPELPAEAPAWREPVKVGGWAVEEPASAPAAGPAAATQAEVTPEPTEGMAAAPGPSTAATTPEIGPMTLAELSAWLRENRIAGDYAGQVARQMWPDTKTAADLTDEQRGALARELAGPDGGAS